MKDTQSNKPEATFHNYPYRAELSRTEVGSPIIKIVPKNPKAPSAHFRQVNIFIYELAAEMERRSAELGARWVISVEAWSARVMVELASTLESERKAADEFIATLLAEHDLA